VLARPMSDYQHSILWRGEDPSKAKFKPAYDGSKKISRYRKGQAPEWAEQHSREEGKSKEVIEKDLRQAKRRRQREAAVIVEDKPKEDAASSRLARLQRSAGAAESSTERLLRHRRVQEATVIEASAADKDDSDEEKKEVKGELDEDKPGVAELKYDEISGSDEDDNELRQLRRDRARELALEKRKLEEDVLKAEVDEDDEEPAEEESEYESESDDDQRTGMMMKPVFVSKVARETVKEKDAIEAEEEEAEKRKAARVQEKKAESKQAVIEKIEEEIEAQKLREEADDNSDVELLDDDDEKDEAEEYEMWKIRELKRIKRDKEERLDRQKEIEFILKRRGMTDEEREADDRRLDKANPQREEAKSFGFMQKYYHRGGFFQDKTADGTEPLYLRDYHEPLEEEKYDKQLLPKAMQLRRGEFGKKGQVKHSHLTESDTTDMTAAWAQSSKQVQRYQEKMAGAKGAVKFDRPGLKQT